VTAALTGKFKGGLLVGEGGGGCSEALTTTTSTSAVFDISLAASVKSAPAVGAVTSLIPTAATAMAAFCPFTTPPSAAAASLP